MRTVVKGPLATPTDLALTDGPEGERLHVADVFAYRVINTSDGAITDPLRVYRDETENPLGVGAGKSKVLITSWSTGLVQVIDRATGAVTSHHNFAAPMDAARTRRRPPDRPRSRQGRHHPDRRRGCAPRSPGHRPPDARLDGGAPDGKLYVTETGGALARVDLATKEITRIAEGLAGPEGVDIGADGRIYVAEAGAGRVIAIDPKDNSKTVLAEGLKFGLPMAEGTLPAFTVTGVAVSKKDGAVYVSSDLTNAIYKLTPSTK